MKRRLLLLSLFSIVSLNVFADGAPNLAGWATTFMNTTIKPAYPIIVGIIFIVTALYNIGDVTGDNKNYKAFFTKLGLFVGAAVAVGIVYRFVSTLSL